MPDSIGVLVARGLLSPNLVPRVTMEAFDVTKLEAERARRHTAYHEFLRVPSLSCGMYALRIGEEDAQMPHAQDEVYHVIRGRGRIRAGSGDADVRTGSVIYVPAGEPHRFHDIVDDLLFLVVFAPAETSASP